MDNWVSLNALAMKSYGMAGMMENAEKFVWNANTSALQENDKLFIYYLIKRNMTIGYTAQDISESWGLHLHDVEDQVKRLEGICALSVCRINKTIFFDPEHFSMMDFSWLEHEPDILH